MEPRVIGTVSLGLPSVSRPAALRRTLLPLLLGLSALTVPPAAASQTRQVQARPQVTWDFETGNLMGWTATGTAFRYQPTQGDNVQARAGGASNHQGEYWIGTYERHPRGSQVPLGTTQGDRPTGTLTSRPFRIQPGPLSFLVGGGSGNDTRVELLVGDPVEQQQKQVLHASGRNSETMRRVRWDLTPFAGQIGVIRIVDQSSAGWGHINADDFVFGARPDTVPNVVGQSLREAEKMLSAARLVLVRGRSLPSDRPRGTVLAQEPAPGGVVQEGDSVTVDVAIWMVVPDLSGLDTARAGALLDQNHLRLGGRQGRPSAEAPGTILSQTPAAGSELPPDASVQIVYAASVPTPNVVGRDSAQARRVLAARGLRVGGVRVRDADQDPGTVVEQSPAPGVAVRLRSAVNVVVASGATVPNVVGLDSLSAGDALRRARLTVGDIAHQRSPAAVGTLIRQSLRPGSVVRPGTAVDIWIAEGVTVPGVLGMSGTQVGDSLTAHGLTLGTTSDTLSSAPIGTVIGQDPDSGSIVPLRSPVNVVLAKGVAVPSVVSTSVGRARRAVAALNLRVGSVDQRESTEPPGTVLSQEPQSGTMVPLESTVSFVVARGVPVPDLSGMDSVRARSVLDTSRLAMGRTELRPDSAPVGSIVGQHPAAADVVALGTPVDVVIAQGVAVPDVKNAARDTAESRVSAQGLILAVDGRKWSLSREGTVLEQDPPAGREVPLRTPVAVVVARHIPIWWLSGGLLLLAGVPLVAVRTRKRRKRKPKDVKRGDNGERGAPAEPRIDLRPHPDPGRQEFAVGEPPNVGLELRWRRVWDKGEATLESSESSSDLIRSERTPPGKSHEGESHEQS